MITFKQYLEESRSAPLYHGTDANTLQQILKDNTLRGVNSDHYSKKSISLTRNLKFARDWVSKMKEMEDPVVIELDQQKLTNRYKIVPFNFWDHTTRRMGNSLSNEFEERINDRDITNLDQYITKIIVFEKPGKPIKGNLILTHPKLFYDGKFVNRHRST